MKHCNHCVVVGSLVQNCTFIVLACFGGTRQAGGEESCHHPYELNSTALISLQTVMDTVEMPPDCQVSQILRLTCSLVPSTILFNYLKSPEFLQRRE